MLTAIKSDPANLDFAKIRNLAAKFKQKYQNLAYQSANSSKVYQISEGARKVFESPAYLSAAGLTYQKLVTISQSQLDIFSADRFLRYPGGSLLQFAGAPEVYLIEEGKKRHLTVKAKEFEKLGFAWTNIKKITSGELSLYPEGPAVVYGPDYELLKDPLGRVYFIESGRKRWVTFGQLFAALGYQWKKVKDKKADYIASILEGPIMSYPDGTLIKGSGAAVYLIEKGQRREFLSASHLRNLATNGIKLSR